MKLGQMYEGSILIIRDQFSIKVGNSWWFRTKLNQRPSYRVKRRLMDRAYSAAGGFDRYGNRQIHLPSSQKYLGII